MEAAEVTEENMHSVEHEKVMERFETLFEKNLPEKGGSFYIQSKIYFAKEFLMQDFPEELNKSRFNPGSEAAEPESEKEASDKSEKSEEPKK
jgi:mitochondrial import inner membrane translocase subunit TIM16